MLGTGVGTPFSRASIVGLSCVRRFCHLYNKWNIQWEQSQVLVFSERLGGVALLPPKVGVVHFKFRGQSGESARGYAKLRIFRASREGVTIRAITHLLGTATAPGTKPLWRVLALVFGVLTAVAAIPLAASGQTSDDFHSMSLNTSLWTVVNPVGNGSVSLNGLDAVLSVPAGTPHDLWTGGNQTLRILQATTNTDFQVEVKFDSIPTAGNQDQGIIVQTDVNNYLRFDVYSDSLDAAYVCGQLCE